VFNKSSSIWLLTQSVGMVIRTKFEREYSFKKTFIDG
jgi:hypothetical protein